MTKRALVVIDLQGEYVEGPLVIRYPDRDDATAKALDAIDVAINAGLPVIVVQHENPAGAAAFGAGSEGFALSPALAEQLDPAWPMVIKRFASAFAGTELAEVLRAREVDTITLVGFMANNCILATAAEAAAVGFACEVLRDATGAINLTNAAGTATAQVLHETLMTLLHSNFAAVASVAEWATAVSTSDPLLKSNLIASATGR
ncbi:MAG: isochorismatase family protein [Cellulomonadaceae bacterium]|jgi:nicotinamidase-related amidase|nr:isochorismatase family protein [Cellulomonadaceae bacterium]